MARLQAGAPVNPQQASAILYGELVAVKHHGCHGAESHQTLAPAGTFHNSHTHTEVWACCYCSCTLGACAAGSGGAPGRGDVLSRHISGLAVHESLADAAALTSGGAAGRANSISSHDG